MIVIHILLAVASLVLGTAALVQPSQGKFRASLGLTVGTIASGFLLAVMGANLQTLCASGLLYTLVVVLLHYGTYRRLQTSSI